MMIQIQRFAFVFSFFVMFLSHAQNFKLTNYGLKEGLPQSQVNAITQDNVGNLWLGTEGGGIASFDGVYFQEYNRSDGLPTNLINDVLWVNGRLHVATNKGLSIKEGKYFINVPFSNISKIAEYNGTVFLATTKGVHFYDGVTMQPYYLKENVLDLEVYEDNLWLVVKNGIHKVQLKSSKKSKAKRVIEGGFEKMALSSNGIFANGINGGIYKYDFNYKLQKVLFPDDFIESIEIFENELWSSVQSKGLHQISTKQFEVKKRYNYTSGLPNNGIQTIFKDRQQNLWLGSKQQGVYKLKTHQFEHLFKGKKILSSYYNKSSMLLATPTELITVTSNGITNEPIVNSISSFSNYKDVILASSSKGLLAIDSIGITSVINKQSGLASDKVKKVVAHKGTIWLLLESNGISKLNYDVERKEVFNHIHFNKADGLYEEDLIDFSIDENDRVWYVSKGGLLGFIRDNDLKHLGRKLPKELEISSIKVHDNSLFIGTNGNGIWRSAISENLDFQNLTRNVSLNSRKINQLIFDVNNSLWLGTNKGVYKIDFDINYKIKNSTHFGYNEGFTSIETTYNSAMIDVYGNLYFGTKSGLMVNKSSQNIGEQHSLSLGFKKVEVVYEPLDTINLQLWEKGAKMLLLNPDQNHISFEFSAVDLDQPHQVVYRWQLNDEIWSAWSQNESVSFPNLNAGDYSFKVEAKSLSSATINPIQFRFSIAQRFTEKLEFKLGVLVLLILIILVVIWGIFTNYKRKTKQKEEQLLLENHLITLEHKALQLQMNPHFIFNVLNGIKALSRTDVEKMNTIINSFSTLLRNTLLNSRKELISLQQEIESLKNYVQVEQLMREYIFEFEVNCAIKEDLEEVLLPSMLVQPFIENAIKHGISDKEDTGKVTVSFNQQGQDLKVEIIDNGVGYYNSKNRIKNVSHQSVAIELSKERIITLAGENTLKIVELKDLHSEVVGTKIAFKIPLITDY